MRRVRSSLSCAISQALPKPRYGTFSVPETHPALMPTPSIWRRNPHPRTLRANVNRANALGPINFVRTHRGRSIPYARHQPRDNPLARRCGGKTMPFPSDTANLGHRMDSCRSRYWRTQRESHGLVGDCRAYHASGVQPSPLLIPQITPSPWPLRSDDGHYPSTALMLRHARDDMIALVL